LKAVESQGLRKRREQGGVEFGNVWRGKDRESVVHGAWEWFCLDTLLLSRSLSPRFIISTI